MGTIDGVPKSTLPIEIKRTLELSMLFCSNIVKGGYFSVSYSSEFRPPILAYLGSNVYLVYNFLHPASQRGEISFPRVPSYMSVWRCGPFCTSGEFQGNVYLLHSLSFLNGSESLKTNYRKFPLKVSYPYIKSDTDHIIEAFCTDCLAIDHILIC